MTNGKQSNLLLPIQLYEQGLREGNLQKLEAAFYPEGNFCFQQSNGEEPSLSCKTFKEVLPAWIVKPDPEVKGKVLFSETTGQMARVSYELQYGGKTYKDLLSLFKSGTQWIIVSKISQVIN